MEEFSDIGSYTRVPRKLIHMRSGQEKSHPTVIQAIAEKLKVNGRNFLPLIIEQVDEEEYEVLFNAHILEAAQEANLNFVWCILADEERRGQIEVEAKQKFEVNLLTASEETIAGMFSYIKTMQPGFSQVNPEQVAKAVVNNRNSSWKSLSPLTKLRCKVGQKKLKVLENYFCVKVAVG